MTYTARAERRHEIQSAFAELEWLICLRREWPRWLRDVLVECCRIKCAHELEQRGLV